MRSDGYQTKGKKVILEFLEANKDTAVSVQDIADYLKAAGEETNITTVYRRLEKLAAEKKVIRRSKIIHLDCEDSREFMEHLCKNHGIVLDCRKTVLYGLCSECSRK